LPLGLRPRALLIAILELRQNLFAEQLDGRAQHVVRNIRRLRKTDHLVDPGVLEIAQPLANLLGSSDSIQRAPFRQREFFGTILELVPDIGLGGFMLAEEAIVP